MSEQFLGVDVKQNRALSHAMVAVRPPKQYKVVLLNDDYTPMDFVVCVLTRFFGCSVSQAVELMLQVHQSGKAVCGVFSRDVAETKVNHVNDFSRENNHPLLCIMEPEL